MEGGVEGIISNKYKTNKNLKRVRQLLELNGTEEGRLQIEWLNAYC